MPNLPLQRSWSSLTLGATPLNGRIVGQQAVDGGRIDDGHRAPCEVEPLLAMIGVRRGGGSGETQLGADIDGFSGPDFGRGAIGGMRVQSSVTSTAGRARRSGRRGPTTPSREGGEDPLNSRRISARIRWS